MTTTKVIFHQNQTLISQMTFYLTSHFHRHMLYRRF